MGCCVTLVGVHGIRFAKTIRASTSLFDDDTIKGFARPISRYYIMSTSVVRYLEIDHCVKCEEIVVDD